MILYQPDFPKEIEGVIRRLPPQVKQAIKQAIRLLCEDPYEGEPLKGLLTGLWKYRARHFRIVYRVETRTKRLQILAVGHRRIVYEELLKKWKGR